MFIHSACLLHTSIFIPQYTHNTLTFSATHVYSRLKYTDILTNTISCIRTLIDIFMRTTKLVVVAYTFFPAFYFDIIVITCTVFASLFSFSVEFDIAPYFKTTFGAVVSNVVVLLFCMHGCCAIAISFMIEFKLRKNEQAKQWKAATRKKPQNVSF